MHGLAVRGSKPFSVHAGVRMRKGDAKLPLPDAAGQVGLQVSFKADKTFDRQIVAEFGKPVKAPYMPSEFLGWLDTEPTLRGMVKTRLDGEVARMGVKLSFSSMIDVGAEVTAKFAKRELNVGGSYHKLATSRWSFEVEFWPKNG